MQNSEKVAIVTGGSKGIGRAVSIRLAADGYRVAILARSVEASRKVVAGIEAQGGKALAVKCDVSDYDGTRQAVAQVCDTLGPVWLLVNNAGIARSKAFIESDRDTWGEIIDTNYKGFLNATHACVPYMIAAGGGCIVSMGSDAGRVGTGGEVVYGGTKEAIVASSKGLARELVRHNIRVNCVSPGPVQTDLLAAAHSPEKGQMIAKMIPMKRLGEPEDVSGVVAFFASDDARYITGQVLSVDGGLTMIG